MEPAARDIGMDRLRFFSDAVFAVVLALLVIHIQIPATYVTSDVLHDLLGDVVPELIGFAVSFAMIAVLWVDHHRLLGHLRGADEGLLWANVAVLLCVVFLVYPAGVLTKHLGAPVAVLFFAGSMVVTGIVWLGLGWYASRNGAVDEGVWRGARLRGGITVGVFALSAPLAPVILTIGGDGYSLAVLAWILALAPIRVALLRID
jgi:uncharacterized membrane protein